MENQNIENNQLENSSVPFVSHFSKLRENPKWLVKLLILIVLALITAFVSYLATKDTVISQSNGQMNSGLYLIISLFTGFFGILFNTAIIFVIFLVISKIFKSDAKGSSIFSAALSYAIIIDTFSLIITIIQALFGLSIFEYKLDSLNIFAKDNKYLMAISLTNVLKAFLTGVVYYSTSRLSKKTSIILGIVALVLLVGFGLISGASGQSMPNMNTK
ncbi:YIP1 family protein [Staphylococcus caprae]|uniref:Yip1 domain-containing protein n=1 Tax=Staphylococcus caprae TaxID=29380 RepID=A0ABM7G054_9STAP|nr:MULTISPECIES: YIP1 family protein [Staphylococcus]EES41273.1 hypothetical protein HMPREF0793_1059 [Staphylococcus caprae M23864:W1]MBN6826699.1 YIP1 family protein [Staphylococcus caprae]MBU5272671.1 YIP1 family protein [Staphylococcus caprae]MBX5316564.1 YIP1 family protein [Staphylococcus caprae]MBX5323751.1 YIP1 family protein [Staphylococcus caprae]